MTVTPASKRCVNEEPCCATIVPSLYCKKHLFLLLVRERNRTFQSLEKKKIKNLKSIIIAFDLWLFFHTCISSPSPLSALTKRHLLLSLPLQPAWLYKAGSSSRGLLYVSDGYGGRRQGRGRRSLDYYDESELEEMTRVFVALFDYDPMSMSPNPDAADEELPFKEGQIIKVVISHIKKALSNDEMTK